MEKIFKNQIFLRKNEVFFVFQMILIIFATSNLKFYGNIYKII